MRSGYYNGEGYHDPTAGAALENIMREERRINKRRKRSPDTIRVVKPEKTKPPEEEAQ